MVLHTPPPPQCTQYKQPGEKSDQQALWPGLILYDFHTDSAATDKNLDQIIWDPTAPTLIKKPPTGGQHKMTQNAWDGYKYGTALKGKM